MKRIAAGLALAVVLVPTANPLSAQEPVVGKLHLPSRPILETPVNFERSIRDKKLGDFLRQIRDKYQCDIAVDQAAFDKKGIKSVGEKTVTIPKIIGAPLEMVLEMAARQVDGTVTGKNGRVSITPGKSRDLGTLAGVPNVKLAAIPVQFELPVERAPLGDICDFLSDKANVTIFVDEWAFEHSGTKNARRSLCDLPAGGASLYEWLNILAKRIDGKAVIGEGLILIVPVEKRN